MIAGIVLKDIYGQETNYTIDIKSGHNIKLANIESCKLVIEKGKNEETFYNHPYLNDFLKPTHTEVEKEALTLQLIEILKENKYLKSLMELPE